MAWTGPLCSTAPGARGRRCPGLHRAAAKTLYQALIEVELTVTIGAVLELVGRAEPLTDERLGTVDDDEPGAGLSRRANR
jgi:hypothetical protein